MREADPHLARLLTDPRGDGAEICEAYVTGYLLTYQFDRGQAVLDAWAADFPRDLQPRLIRARLSKKNQDWKGAESAYRQVLEVAPASAEAMLGLADVLATQQRPADALEFYLQVPAGSLEAIPARAGAATCLVTLGRVSQAREILSDLLTAHPDQPLGLRALGRVELEAGNYQKATGLLRKSQLQEPENDETLYLLAGALRGIGKVDEARQLSSKVKQIREANVEINRLATIVAQEPDNVAARYKIGQLLVGIGMRKEALVWFRSVLQFEPGHAAARDEIERDEPRGKKDHTPPAARQKRDETAD
jgi:tetratricopeptide (TPR) repeat protein